MRRDPIHVVYGGAHLFRSGIAEKLGRLALRALETHGSPESLGITEFVWERVIQKLRAEPVEDYRIDFEDGYGYRSDDDEDAEAVRCADEFRGGGPLPPLTGIRIKPLSERSRKRALRTLRLFLERANERLPASFVVTLPKARYPEQVSELIAQLPAGTAVELLIETPEAMRDSAAFVEAAQGRCVAAHFGAYDYLSACGVPVVDQHLLHPACDAARDRMRLALAGAGVRISDGVTNVLPVGDDPVSIRDAWRLHMRHIRHALAGGFYQGWDVHPAQIPARYAAVYSFFHEHAGPVASRLRKFLDEAAQATLVGSVFDDIATGQGLLTFFVRAWNCGAFTEPEIRERTGLTLDDLRSGWFPDILERRQPKPV
jgi:citrate lyase beta subunit